MTVSRRTFLAGVGAVASVAALPSAVAAAPEIDRYTRVAEFGSSMTPEFEAVKASCGEAWRDAPRAAAMFARWSAGIDQMLEDFPEEFPDYGWDAIMNKIFKPDLTAISLRDDIEPGILPVFMVRHMLRDLWLPLGPKCVPAFSAFVRRYHEPIFNERRTTTSLKYIKRREEVLARENRKAKSVIMLGAA